MTEADHVSKEEKDRLIRALRERLRAEGDSGDDAVRAVIEELILSERQRVYLSVEDRRKLKEMLFASVRGLDVLQPLLDDPSVTEIMVNGPKRIYIERAGKLMRWPSAFSSREKLEDVIQKIVGECDRVINERRPIADARLPDGSRINAVIEPVALDGPVLTIRRFPKDPITMDQLIRLGSLTEEAARELASWVRAGRSILISGGTSAGKTTFLNALSGSIPADDRVITIEDNAELQIQGISNLVRLEAKAANMEGNREITIRDLIRTSLRMRPDRLIVGEVRGEEAAELLQALNTGHRGSLSTIHANSAVDTLTRLETLVLMALDMPLRAIRSQIRSAIDLIVHLGRLPDGSRRVLEIAQILKDGTGSRTADEIRLRRLYRWEDEEGRLLRLDGFQEEATDET